jgi:hypothetical protein
MRVHKICGLAVLSLSLSVPAWAGDPAQYNLVQSSPTHESIPVTNGSAGGGGLGPITEMVCFALNPKDPEFTCLPANDPRAAAEMKRVDSTLAATRSPSDQPKAQLDRIEALLRAICSRQSIGQPTSRYAEPCPQEPKP